MHGMVHGPIIGALTKNQPCPSLVFMLDITSTSNLHCLIRLQGDKQGMSYSSKIGERLYINGTFGQRWAIVSRNHLQILLGRSLTSDWSGLTSGRLSQHWIWRRKLRFNFLLYFVEFIISVNDPLENNSVPVNNPHFFNRNIYTFLFFFQVEAIKFL